MNHKGQITLMFVMILGVLLAMLVVFGWQRYGTLTKETSYVEDGIKANSVFTQAAKVVQQMYFGEASCDPDVLDQRLSLMENLPSTTLSTGVTYVIASTTPAAGGLTLDERMNRCSAGDNAGCRQIGIELDGRGYIVTIGTVSGLADSSDGGTPDPTSVCPRDATFRMSLAIRGRLFVRRATLINLCTLKSCEGAEFFDSTYGAANQPYKDVSAFDSVSACGQLPALNYGDVVGTDTRLTVDDLRWLRRYVNTGGGSIGSSSFINFTTTVPAGENGVCPASDSKCTTKPCVPSVDLDLNETNNDADIAIMEYHLRGYGSDLPAIKFTN